MLSVSASQLAALKRDIRSLKSIKMYAGRSGYKPPDRSQHGASRGVPVVHDRQVSPPPQWPCSSADARKVYPYAERR